MLQIKGISSVLQRINTIKDKKQKLKYIFKKVDGLKKFLVLLNLSKNKLI
jgi:hypothetical protein